MNVNSTARVRARFVEDGDQVDPDTLVMIVTPPDANGLPDPASAYTITYPSPYLVRQDDKTYFGYVPVDARGRWRVEMRGTGQGAGSAFVTFYAYD